MKKRIDPALQDFADAARAPDLQPDQLLDLARHEIAAHGADVDHQLGVIAILRRLGAQEAACQLCAEQLAAHPDEYRLALMLAQSHASLNRFDAAFAACSYVLAHRPDDLEALAEKARLHLLLGQYPAAWEAARSLPERHPGRADLWALRAAAAYEAGQGDDARIACKAALALDPANANALGTFGHLYAANGDFAKARSYYLKVAALEPHNARIQYMLGYSSLAMTDFAAGWRGYAWRHRVRPPITVDGSLGLPLWAPADGASGRLLVWAEQGIGEEILFSGLLPDLVRMGVQVVLACDARLVPLLQRSFPSINVIPRDEPGRAQDLGATAQIALADLGGVFRTSVADFDRYASYLVADPARVAHFRQRYQALAGPGRRVVGIAWRSGNQFMGTHKSGRLTDFVPLLADPAVFSVSLQYGDVSADIAGLAASGISAPFLDPEVDPLQSLEAQAAQIAALDGIISTSNSAVHLAGALGIGGLVLLARGRGLHWYWSQPDGPSRWYPSLRLCFGAAGEPPSAQLAAIYASQQTLGKY